MWCVLEDTKREDDEYIMMITSDNSPTDKEHLLFDMYQRSARVRRPRSPNHMRQRHDVLAQGQDL